MPGMGTLLSLALAESMTATGRPLPAVDVSYPVAQVGGQLSGGEIARPTGASRPSASIGRYDPDVGDAAGAVVRIAELDALKRSSKVETLLVVSSLR